MFICCRQQVPFATNSQEKEATRNVEAKKQRRTSREREHPPKKASQNIRREQQAANKPQLDF